MSVYDEFVGLFRSTPPPVPISEDAARAELEERELRRAAVSDMRAFLGTDAYRELRRRIHEEIAANAPKPQLGSDVSACFTFKQEGLRSALAILDTMVRLAEEARDDG